MEEDNNLEFKGLDIHDILGLSKPITKLVETVSAGIGTLYEPIHIRRMAKAKGFEMQLISNTINSNLQLPTKYENGNVIVDSTNANELVQRAKNRLLFQEMKKQQNIESVVSKAASELSIVKSVSDTPVEDDWVSEFFDCVANVSNEKMQILWGKVLAGEVEKPGKFSKRTLDVLKKISQKEAEMFEEYAKFVLCCPLGFEYNEATNDYFIPAEHSFKQKYNILFSTIVFLADAGLLSYDNGVCAGPILPPQGNGYLYYRGQPAIEFFNTKNEKIELYRRAYLLTSAGKELLTIVECLQDIQKTQAYLEDSKKLYCSNDFFEFEDCIETQDKPIGGLIAKVIYE